MKIKLGKFTIKKISGFVAGGCFCDKLFSSTKIFHQNPDLDLIGYDIGLRGRSSHVKR